MSLLSLALVLVSVALTLLVALQSKRGDLSFMGSQSDDRKFERRGPEKLLHIATIICWVGFVLLSLGHFILF